MKVYKRFIALSFLAIVINLILVKLFVILFFQCWVGCAYLNDGSLGGWLSEIYWLLAGSIFVLIPFVNGPAYFIFLFKKNPKIPIKSAILYTLLWQLFTFVLTVIIALAIVEFLWRFNIPFPGKGYTG